MKKNKVLLVLLISIIIGIIFYIRKDIYYDFKGLVLSISSFTKKEESNYILSKQTNELEEDIKTLKEQLKLNKALTEYDIENATVLNRNKIYWLSTLTIDKGKTDGIDKDMLVVTGDGLIGKIQRVYKDTSEVKLITANDKDFKISVVINVLENDYYGILSGYNQKTKSLIINGIDKDSNIDIGNVVTTSGIGVFFPKGIYIGRVNKVIYDKYNLSKKVYVEIKQDFNSIHYVAVLKGLR